MDLGYGVNATVARAEEQEDPQVASGGRACIAATVRYQVWAHLTDSKAKRIEALYAQLGNHERVPAFAEIQRDAHPCFPGDVRLSRAAGYALTGILDDGPGHSMMQRWDSLSFVRTGTEGLTWFVPLGLAFIAGQLLLQSPEEDAFWIFISLMDSHLWPYFSSNATNSTPPQS